jgi:hypothetical protein
MSITIDVESKKRERESIDINFFGDRFKTENEIFTFPSPVLETIEQHLFYLLKFSNEEKFNKKYMYRPDYLSFDKYGTVNLAHVLMYINGAKCIEEFDFETVVVPDFSAILEILKDKFPQRQTEDLSEVSW